MKVTEQRASVGVAIGTSLALFGAFDEWVSKRLERKCEEGGEQPRDERQLGEQQLGEQQFGKQQRHSKRRLLGHAWGKSIHR
jgi:hypothetical protein